MRPVNTRSLAARPCPLAAHATSARATAPILAAALALVAGCGGGSPTTPPAQLAAGTWGSDSAGVIANDTITHVHVACTYGNFPAPVTLDASGRFSVAGEYLLRAYPIAVGPALPAQLAGVVAGNRLTLTVAVNDTVEKKLVVLGPVNVYFGKQPNLGPCPICVTPRALPGAPPEPVRRLTPAEMPGPRRRSP